MMVRGRVLRCSTVELVRNKATLVVMLHKQVMTDYDRARVGKELIVLYI